MHYNINDLFVYKVEENKMYRYTMYSYQPWADAPARNKDKGIVTTDQTTTLKNGGKSQLSDQGLGHLSAAAYI
jgi:hypothetical protein